MDRYRIGIDLGGTKIEIIAIDAQGTTLLRRRIQTPQDNYQEIIKAITDLVLKAENELQKSARVGIGIPGSVSPATGLIRNANSTSLNDRPLLVDLENHLKRKIRIANDANCFALSEAIDGIAADAYSVFGVIIGTGTGGGIVIDKNIITGKTAIGGEWGHNPLPWMTAEEFPGLPCWCGRSGCNETFLSGSGLSRHFHRITGKQLKAEQIVELAETGNAQAMALMKNYEIWLAKGLASVINLLDPDVIVLGGGMSNISSLYNSIPKLLTEYIFSDTYQPDIRKAQYGDSSGVRGAAWLWDV